MLMARHFSGGTGMASDLITLSDDIINRFRVLFGGGVKGHGVRSIDGTVRTDKTPAIFTDYLEHLKGTRGLGISPILGDRENCSFAAIDIDRPEGASDKGGIDVEELEKKTRDLNAPVLVCRSKSGGGHVFIFFKEPQPAVRVRKVLALISTALGYPSAEIFPKQNSLTINQIGNWINLPYFDYKKTDRACFQNGRFLDLLEFLDLAEKYKSQTTKQELDKGLQDIDTDGYYSYGIGWKAVPFDFDPDSNIDHHEAPPCLQPLFLPEAKIPQGCRNDVLAFIVIYLKRAFPATFKNLAQKWAVKHLENGLSEKEVDTTIKSASRRDYSPRCHCCALIEDLCDSETCRGRIFGIIGREIDFDNAIKDAEEKFEAQKRDVTPSPKMPEYLENQKLDTFTGDIDPETIYNDFEKIPENQRFTIELKSKDKKAKTIETMILGPLVQHKRDDGKSVWTLFVNKNPIQGTSAKMLSFSAIQAACMEHLILLPIKAQLWETGLKSLLKHTIVIDVPEATTQKGVIKRFLATFADAAREGARGSLHGEWGDVITLRDKAPIIRVIKKQPYILFRVTDFLKYLKTNSDLTLSMSELWLALEKIGAKMLNGKVNGFEEDLVSIPEKCLPERGNYLDEAEETEIESEF